MNPVEDWKPKVYHTIMNNLARYLLICGLFLFLVLPVFAQKPATPSQKPGGEPPIPNSVCLDPGHGGNDIGAVNGDLLEKNINLEVSNKLATLLTAASYTVFQTRTDDNTLSNEYRYNYCNSQRAAILVSIHHNGSSDSNLDYSTALYMKKPDVALAQIVVNTVSSQLGLPNHGISRFASGVLLKADMPATISEGFFLTNTIEADLIKNANRLDQEAQALFAAIESYFATH